jgi:tripartite-type tricarboxylate transporter receptor subunit TctC
MSGQAANVGNPSGFAPWKAFTKVGGVLALQLVALLMSGRAFADDVESFYRNKQLQLVVGFGPGAAYDTFGRLAAQFLPRYIPGHPTIVIENKPGAASLIAANYLYSVAPKDGSVIGTINRDMALLAEIDSSNVRFDPRKFTWIGTPSDYKTDGFLMWVRDDVHKQLLSGPDAGAPITIASTAKGSNSNDVAHLLQTALNLNMKIIDGYQDDAALTLAVDRKEADGIMIGMTAVSAIRPDWLRPGSGMHVVLQFGPPTRLAKFPDAPTASELAKDDLTRSEIEVSELPFKLGFPLLAPPDLPADRTEALRKAYMEMSSDWGYLAEVKKLNLMYNPVGGAELEASVQKIHDAPPQIFEALRKLRGEAGH